jgi:hypothetical protein
MQAPAAKTVQRMGARQEAGSLFVGCLLPVREGTRRGRIVKAERNPETVGMKPQAPNIKPIPYGCHQHQQWESWNAKHTHSVSEDGAHYIVGNGTYIARVVKPGKKFPRGAVWFIGDDGINEWGDPFNYSDYFLPEELESA